MYLKKEIFQKKISKFLQCAKLTRMLLERHIFLVTKWNLCFDCNVHVVGIGWCESRFVSITTRFTEPCLRTK